MVFTEKWDDAKRYSEEYPTNNINQFDHGNAYPLKRLAICSTRDIWSTSSDIHQISWNTKKYFLYIM